MNTYNLKLSQLPEGTVIDDERHGEYIKRADGIWEETSMDYMGDRERVTDTGYIDGGVESYPAFLKRTNLAWREPAETYFKNYKIISLPIETVTALLDNLHEFYNSDSRLRGLPKPSKTGLLLQAFHKGEARRERESD
jgi:hypothetical protein